MDIFLRVFPACAGVILTTRMEVMLEDGFPRMRGGDPNPDHSPACKGLFSPHARG